MKPVPRFIWTVQWGNPYTPPPAGMERVQLQVTTETRDCPAEIEDLHKQLGFGSGWCVAFGAEMPEGRKLTAEQKGKLRRRSLERRVHRKAPLFANELIEAAITSDPAYYAGEDVKR